MLDPQKCSSEEESQNTSHPACTDWYKSMQESMRNGTFLRDGIVLIRLIPAPKAVQLSRAEMIVYTTAGDSCGSPRHAG